MQDPRKYRENAAECRRTAEKANGNDRHALLNIADAWEQQARFVENTRKKPE
jgi:hypothetical protein